MNEYDIYKYIDSVVAALYLFFIFLSIQIWLLWKDVDKKELQIKTLFSESFFKKNCIYVFSFGIFFMSRSLIEGTSLPGAVIYFKFFEMLGIISIVLFAYGWYTMLKKCAYKKSLPQELTKTR